MFDSLNSSFFSRSAREVARYLIGRTMVRTVGGRRIEAVVTEVAAHEGGGGASRRGMCYAPGTVFVMSFRGHLFLNIATGAEGEPSCVWIRGARITTDGTTVSASGPAVVARMLKITRDLDGQRPSDLWMEGDPVAPQLIAEEHGAAGNCVGVYKLAS